MGSKPALVDGVAAVHAFVEPDWTSFDRPLPDGTPLTYVRESDRGVAVGPALCVKLKRREAFSADARADAAIRAVTTGLGLSPEIS